eukprot:TRINITY_DN16562_c0_g1_i5.p1 TRINITY_DN16562_c0_g1~~TRINITY_DN16562_c0_g1_i5.p1  ORF type:complete len:190 (+),score=49.25 TRINITY_DN16562_c0_g1_i5:160-729(+)
MLRSLVGSEMCIRDRGVHLRGSVAAGTAVAIYPGTAYDNVADIALMARFLQPGNEYMYFRGDGILLDGRTCSGRSGMVHESLRRRYGQTGDGGNQWSVGNRINHPPEGVEVNCQITYVNVTQEASQEVREFFGSACVTFTTDKHATAEALNALPLYSMVIVAARDLKDEELWIDYLLAEKARPDWYQAK